MWHSTAQRNFWLLVVGAGFPAACGGQVDDNTGASALARGAHGENVTPEGGPAAGGAGGVASGVGTGGLAPETGGASGIGGASGGSSAKDPLCTAPFGNRFWPETPEAVAAALQGTWVRCGQALSSDEAEIGLEITADNHFSILVLGPNGSPVPATSVFERGTVSVTPLPNTYNGHLSYDVDFNTDGNVAYRERPFFSDDVPPQMVTNNTDFIALRYVRLTPP